jgi:hypothetical protein
MAPRDVCTAVLAGALVALAAESVRWLVITHDPLWALSAVVAIGPVLRATVRR